MDTHAVARQFAADLIAHRDKLAGKAEDAVQAQYALHQTAEAVSGQYDDHKKERDTVLSHWDGKSADHFAAQSEKFGKQLKSTGATSSEAEKIVSGVTASLSGGHTTAHRLVDEYVAKASALLDAGFAVSGTGAQAAVLKAVAAAADLVPKYVRQSATNLRRVDGELRDAAKKLRALEKDLDHDDVTSHGTTKAAGSPSTGEGKGHDIVAAARKELGTRENPPGSNKNPYGPTASWCSSFATAMWRKAGVKIPILPFTGDVYHWGQEHGKAYGKNSLDHAKPGDVLLFGTGPQSPSTSTHIGIVEKVEGDKVIMIEGNSGDAVRRNTHTLSSATFYGGVHP